MKKITITAMIVIATALSAAAQHSAELDNLLGRFQQLYNSQQFDSIQNLLSARLQGMSPADKTKAGMAGLYGQMGSIEQIEYLNNEESLSYYRVRFSKQTMRILTSLSPEKKLDALRFVADKKEVISDPGAPASAIELKTTTGTIHGTLSLPVATGKVPVVLLIAGSGPTDRDGNNNMGLKTNTYLMLADSLQKAGIACLRYDKRGVGESASAISSEKEMTIDIIVSDAVGFINMLKADPRFSAVIIAGHSEGSLIGMIAAQKTSVKKYISIAGAGEGADDILKTQITAQSPDLVEKVMAIMDSIKKGYEVTDVPEGMSSLFRPSVQPYMRSWLRYDPAKEIKKLKIPILILQGNNDLQVEVKDAENLKKAAPAARLVIIDKMNHVLKAAPSDKQGNYGTYINGDLPLDGELSAAVVGFIKAK